MQEYLVIEFNIKPSEDFREILIALLDNLNYDSFEETESGLKAYILEKDFKREELDDLWLLNLPEVSITYDVEKLENKNWNEEWETHYDSIKLNSDLYIRAPFHPELPDDFKYQIEIIPKMSFGTGHHQTTRLMARLILEMNVENKIVLDMGTGTGILAILSEMRGAKKVDAIDNFEWAVENTRENASRNNCYKTTAILGDATTLGETEYDVIIANINRNVLLEDMKSYTSTLSKGGTLALSGFFEEDFDLINSEALKNGLKFEKKINEGKWVACLYTN